MNENDYGKAVFNRTDDGKKELRISESQSVIGTLLENAEPGAEDVDQIAIIDDASGRVKRVIESDKNQQKKKGSPLFAVGILAFMAIVVIFMLFAK